MSTTWRIALSQYEVTFIPDFAAYRRKIEGLIGAASRSGAKLLLFPEYASLELVSLLSGMDPDDLGRQRRALQAYLTDFRQLFRTQSQAHGLYIVAPSIPVAIASGRFVNRVHLYSPAGGEGFQDKIHMTRFEDERFGVSSGAELKVFATALGCLAVAICFDVEFPLIARAQATAGARLILVPSCTDTLTGYRRVRTGAQARALENQCLVAVSPTVGVAPWSSAIDTNVGAAGLFGPPDRGLPWDGVLALGSLGQPGWVYADVDLAVVDALEDGPEVFLRRQWHASFKPMQVAVETLA